MANKQSKYNSLEELRQAQREQSRKWYLNNRDKRLQSMKDYYQRTKASKDKDNNQGGYWYGNVKYDGK